MNESDSFEQKKTDGISEQVDALKGFLDEQGLAGGSSSAADGGGDTDGKPSAPPDRTDDASFDSAVSAIESRWTAHSGEAPEHEPVRVHHAEAEGETGGRDGHGADDGWKPVTAPDGEELDERGGSSDGSESGQDAGSMS